MDLTASTIAPYLVQRGLIAEDEEVQITPLSGGNLNYTYRVKTSSTSLILKQAREKIKFDIDLPVTKERTRFETNALKVWRSILPDHVPKVHYFDSRNHVLVMEEIPPAFTLLTYELLSGNVNLSLACAIARFAAATHSATYNNKALHRMFSSMELFDIFKMKFFHEEFLHSTSNMSACRNIREAIVKCHRNRIALIQGDYQPKNILVNGNAFYVVDYELATYGDPAHDLGNMLAHYLLAAIINYPIREKYFTAMEAMLSEYRKSFKWKDILPALERNALLHFAPVMYGRISGSIKVNFIDARTKAVAERIITLLGKNPAKTLPDAFDLVRKEAKSLGGNKPLAAKNINGVLF